MRDFFAAYTNTSTATDSSLYRLNSTLVTEAPSSPVETLDASTDENHSIWSVLSTFQTTNQVLIIAATAAVLIGSVLVIV